MKSYNSLSVELMDNDISSMSKPHAPVNVGDCFYYNSRRCEVKALFDNYFTCEFVNQSLRNEIVNEYRITYTYWQSNMYKDKKLRTVLSNVPNAIYNKNISPNKAISDFLNSNSWKEYLSK